MAIASQGRVTRRGQCLSLRAPGLNTDVHISAGVIGTLPDVLGSRSALVVVDASVWRSHRTILEPLLQTAPGRPHPRLILPGGESIKTPENLARLWKRCAAVGLPRDGVIVGIGGGTILDLAGFAAATWMRGTSFVAIPTTLLAAADASVGGKTAVDLDGLKNPVGAFHAAETVLIDPDLLATLPRREWRCGMAEVVKMAVISEPKLFRALEYASQDLRAHLAAGAARSLVPEIGDLPWSEWLQSAVMAKARIVAHDFREEGHRRVLNLGHTLAHALEPLLEIPHGEAVALGLSAVTRAATADGICTVRTRDRILALLQACGLPTECMPPHLNAVAKYVTRDKKMSEGKVDWIVPTAIGKVISAPRLSLTIILPHLQK